MYTSILLITPSIVLLASALLVAFIIYGSITACSTFPSYFVEPFPAYTLPSDKNLILGTFSDAATKYR
jgi:hypothetical protein